MADFSKQLLSGSTDGKQIKITPTATAGETIHTAHAVDLDEIWLYANNTSASAVDLTIEWGGVTVDDNLVVSIPGKSGDVRVIEGKILTGSKVLAAFAGTADVINVSGYVNRIT